MRLAARLATLYLIAACGGFAFYRLGLPLPWMMGPLVVTAALTLSGALAVRVPVQTRPFGQGIVAAQVGLGFTPAVFASLLDRGPLLLGASAMTIATAFIAALLLSRLARVRLSAALIATTPTSPVEASIIAERYGFPGALIILAQTLRISAIVVLVPLAIYFIDGIERQTAPLTIAFEPVGTLIVLSLAVAGAVLFLRLGIATPFFLGPLAFSAAVTAAGIDLPSFPSIVIWAAQLVLGTWLGSGFQRSLFTAAGRMVSAVIVSSLFFILLAALLAVVAAWLMGVEWEMAVLATAPGGVTEMALTAKFLGADVALITAFHLTRIFIIVPLLPFLVDRLHRFEERRGRHDPG